MGDKPGNRQRTAGGPGSCSGTQRAHSSARQRVWAGGWFGGRSRRPASTSFPGPEAVKPVPQPVPQPLLLPDLVPGGLRGQGPAGTAHTPSRPGARWPQFHEQGSALGRQKPCVRPRCRRGHRDGAARASPARAAPASSPAEPAPAEGSAGVCDQGRGPRSHSSPGRLGAKWNAEDTSVQFIGSFACFLRI